MVNPAFVFKNLNNTTKLAQKYLASYFKSSATELHDVYKTCSQAKAEMFGGIKGVVAQLGGTDLRIIYANNFVFVTGYMLGNQLIVDTPTRRYSIDVEAQHVETD